MRPSHEEKARPANLRGPACRLRRRPLPASPRRRRPHRVPVRAREDSWAGAISPKGAAPSLRAVSVSKTTSCRQQRPAGRYIRRESLNLGGQAGTRSLRHLFRRFAHIVAVSKLQIWPITIEACGPLTGHETRTDESDPNQLPAPNAPSSEAVPESCPVQAFRVRLSSSHPKRPPLGSCHGLI